MKGWKTRAIEATRGTQLGAIINCTLDRGKRDYPRFVGKAVVTSDGFLQCNFVGVDGDQHLGAFIGRVSDLSKNIEGLAEHLKLNAKDHEALTAAVTGWIRSDYRSL